MGLLNLKVCQATCVIGVIASISAIASLILGFILMGTFHATYVHTCVGIWCGLLMFLHVITSGVMLGSRKYVAGILYIIANFVCLAFTVYGIIVAYDYFKSFSDYRKYNDEGACALKLGTCRCSPVKGGMYGEFYFFIMPYITTTLCISGLEKTGRESTRQKRSGFHILTPPCFHIFKK